MGISLFDKLEKESLLLKKQVSKYDTESVLGFIANKLLSTTDTSKSVFETTELISPYSQYLYLAGLLLSTEENGNKKILEKDFKKICKHLDHIALLYIDLFFPSKGESIVDLSTKWQEAVKISMPTFLNYFNTISLAYPEQVINRIERYFFQFTPFYEETYQIKPDTLIEIYKYIGDVLQKNSDDVSELLKKMNEERIDFEKRIDRGMSSSDSFNLIDKEIATDLHKKMMLMFHIEIKDLEEKFGENSAQSFINLFSLNRINRGFKFYTEENPINNSPIWKKSTSYLFIPFYKHVIDAIYTFLYSSIEKSSNKEKFYKWRDNEAEKKVKELFQMLFKDNATYHSAVFETNSSQNEHDLIVLYKNILILVEVKAAKIKEPFRDPEKAFIRIQRDFNSDGGIQKAYEQGNNLKQLILKNEETPLYDQQGNEVVVIKRAKYEKFFIMCITAENYGMIEANLSLLLKKSKEEPYPLAMDIYSFESIIEAFLYKNIATEQFIKYLTIREMYHDKFFVTDELEICGYFLENGNFDQINETTMCIMDPGMSNIFDKIYFEKHGIILDDDRQIPQGTLVDGTSFFTKDVSKNVRAIKVTKQKKHKRKMQKESRRRNRK